MKKTKIDEGMVQTIFVGLLVIAFGVLAGWFLNITTTLTTSFIGTLFVGFWMWDMRKNKGGGGSGALGVFFIFMVPLMMFIIISTITGFIVHWDDLLYMLRGLFR